ncbi:hypothetical protein PENSPDRAFT_282538 [Peniophora sp. CONT]|nr:hypothetical protein PENSPDRAFT_282538 [Peniophora sp. CONT]
MYQATRKHDVLSSDHRSHRKKSPRKGAGRGVWMPFMVTQFVSPSLVLIGKSIYHMGMNSKVSSNMILDRFFRSGGVDKPAVVAQVDRMVEKVILRVIEMGGKDSDIEVCASSLAEQLRDIRVSQDEVDRAAVSEWFLPVFESPLTANAKTQTAKPQQETQQDFGASSSGTQPDKRPPKRQKTNHTGTPSQATALPGPSTTQGSGSIPPEHRLRAQSSLPARSSETSGCSTHPKGRSLLTEKQSNTRTREVNGVT